MTEPEDERKPLAPSREEKQALGKNLAEARKAAGYTQDAVAIELSTIKQTVSAWENGRNMPDPLSLRGLAKLYGTTVDALVGNVSLSAEAVRFATSYDSLAQEQRAVFRVMWNAYIQQVTSESLIESVELSPQHRLAAEDERKRARYSSARRDSAPGKKSALHEAGRYAEDGNEVTPDQRSPLRKGGGRH